MSSPVRSNFLSRILSIRGERVILDSDLAAIYGVPTKRLNEQVKRNRHKFPSDFMFRLTAVECKELLRSRSQNATLKRGKNIKYQPYAFTEHGAVMAANILNSSKAVEMSVFVVRAFVRMRTMMAGHRELSKKLAELERALTARLDVHESAIVEVLRKITELLCPPAEPTPPPHKPRIGFHP